MSRTRNEAIGQPSSTTPLRAFQACGIELEYALVGRRDLEVAALADQALRLLGGSQAPVSDVPRGMFGWSNELTLHVVEIKNEDPTVPMDLLASRFQFEVREMNRLLHDLDARLMPSGMHPWMDPKAQTTLWPHENAAIYRAYDRIFDCRTHGYANLQSMHVNLPFADDAEFGRLHDAIRLVLPILPALAASSPFVEGRWAGTMDYRLHVYRSNAARVPELTGALVPDRCAGRDEYHRSVLQPMYDAISAHDPERLMQHEWLNARGAVARFQRHAIEIRVLDTQECPRMDIGIAALLVDLVQALTEGRLPASQAMALPTRALADILDRCIRDAECASLDHSAYLRAFGMRRQRCLAGDLWECIGERLQSIGSPRFGLWRSTLNHIQTRGPLARRLLALAGSHPDRRRLRATYEHLCAALDSGTALN